MSDLISRQAAIDALEETDWYHQNKNKDMVHGANSNLHQAWYKEQDVFKAIEQLPSAQPEQKKGEWVLKTLDDGNGEFQLYECSSCGIYISSRRPFCCNCGAKMDGET